MPGKSKKRQAIEQAAKEIVEQAFSIKEGRYLKAFDRQAHGYALLGHTDTEIAELLGVSESTFDTWKVENPSLRAALRKARVDAYVGVARALHRSARGYTLKDKRVKTNGKGEVLEVIEQKRHFPPNNASAGMLLTNRLPDQWKERKSVEHSGAISLAALVEALHVAADPASQAKEIEAKRVDPED